MGCCGKRVKALARLHPPTEKVKTTSQNVTGDVIHGVHVRQATTARKAEPPKTVQTSTTKEVKK